MPRPLRLIIPLTLLVALLLVTLLPPMLPVAAQVTDCTLDTLPRPGTGTLPPGSPAISGYVVVNQQVMVDATIMARVGSGSAVELPLLSSPSVPACAKFYELPLNQAPLNLQVGQTVTFEVSVSGLRQSFAYTVPSGGGRFDLTLATTAGCRAPTQTAQQMLAQADLRFEQNVGQADAAAPFFARTAAGMAFFTPEGLVLQSPTANGVQQATLEFIGAQTMELSGEQELAGPSNYILAHAQTYQAPNYAAVLYRELYPGVALRYDGGNGRLKGTYTLAPGVDPALLRWRYPDGTPEVVADSGDLLVNFANGMQLRESAPIAWQDGATGQLPVAVAFALHADGSVGFTLGAYDRQLPLIIDPDLMWSTFFGGNSHDWAWDVAVDALCNVYFVGATRSSDLPLHNPFQDELRGDNDLFVASLTPDGSTLRFSTYIGGSGNELTSPDHNRMGMAIGLDGSIYIAGATQSPDFPTTPGAFDRTFRTGTCTGGREPEDCYDAFVTKLHPDGTLAYSSLLGGSGHDHALAIAVDAQGRAYVGGQTLSPDFPVTADVADPICGSNEGFVVRFNAAGSALEYATCLGGEYADAVTAIVVDSAGNAYVSGDTYSPDFPLSPNSFDTSHGGDADAFVAKLASDGRSLIYSSFIGGSGGDHSRGIALAPDGSVYVTGNTNSPDLPTTAGSFDPTHNGGWDGFLVRVSADGRTRLFSTFIGGELDEVFRDVEVARDGTVYLAGWSESNDFPITADAADAICGGPDAPCRAEYPDGVLVGVQPDGSALSYATYLGGEGQDWLYGLAIDAADAIYVVGSTDSGSLPGVVSSVYDPVRNLGRDALVSRFAIGAARAEAQIDPVADWTLMFYIAGDNQDIASFLHEKQRELQAAARDNLRILVLSDGPLLNDSMRYLVEANGIYQDGVNRWPMGELNMGDPATLSDFIAWGQSNYPANHYYLNIANHGGGTTGIAWDETSQHDMLTIDQLRSALREGTANGLVRIDLLHLDACLMGMFEVAFDVAEFADYVVASQNLGWSLFAFGEYAQAAGANPSPRQLAAEVAR
ncbi:MAG: hypothetical protein EI684_14310, partial [Candidatus Viridilinea halotolerans]